MLRKPARATMLALVIVLLAAQVVAAGVATADPIFKVPADSAGNPLPFTVRAQGFTPGSLVFVEECDGVSPSSVGWDVTVNCDPGDTTPPVLADSSGVATFTAGGAHSFTPFKGESPSSLFNCLSPNQASPAALNGLNDFRNCKLRVSSNNSDAPASQKFLNIELPDSAGTFDAKFASGVQVAGSATPAGSCQGSVALAKVTTATPGAGLSDQTQDVTISGTLLKDIHSAPVVLGGACSGLINSKYAGTGAPAGPPTTLGALTESAATLKLSGASSCAWNAASIGADGTAASSYVLSGTLTIVFTTAPFKLTISVTLKHDPAFSDVWDVSGQVTKGLSMGAQVSGSVYLDPVAKFGGSAANVTSNVGPIPTVKPVGYTGYGLDASLTSAFTGCSNGVASDTNSPAVSNPATVRTDTGTTHTGLATVDDTSISSTDQGFPVTGAGIPANAFVGTVTPGASFQLSSSPTAQIDVNVPAGQTAKPIKITTDPARSIAAQTGVPLWQLGDGVSPLGNTTTGLVFNF